jgi:hypothetical protein
LKLETMRKRSKPMKDADYQAALAAGEAEGLPPLKPDAVRHPPPPPPPPPPPLPPSPAPRQFEIRTKVRGFSGERAGLKFVDGVAVTGDAKAAELARNLGYAVSLVPREMKIAK